MDTRRAMSQQRRQRHHGDAGAAHPTSDPATLTVHVPLAFRQRRGRKVLVAPGGTGEVLPTFMRSTKPVQSEVTPAVRALARAFRWRKLLETGTIATVHEIAAAEYTNPSYVSRVLRLTLLAPEIVETISAGTPEASPPLGRLLMPFPVEWERSAVSIGPK